MNKKNNISKTCVIHKNVKLGEDIIIHDFVVIYPNTIIKDGVEIYDHCVLGKLPTSPGIIKRKLKTKYPPLIIGKNSILCPGVVVYAGTKIGSRCLLGDNLSIREECSIGDECILSRNVTINYNTSIGNNVKIMDTAHITGNAVIEDDVFISVLVSTTNDNSMGRKKYDENMKGPTIKRAATIGAAANILPGIEIGENSIVAAGAVVTKNVPKNVLVMGIPAIVKRELKEEEIK